MQLAYLSPEQFQTVGLAWLGSLATVSAAAYALVVKILPKIAELRQLLVSLHLVVNAKEPTTRVVAPTLPPATSPASTPTQPSLP